MSTEFKIKVNPCPPATVENDAVSPTYTDTVNAGNTLVLPAQSIEVNDVVEGSINSVGTIDINITDGTDPVVPDSVDITGRTVTIAVPSGGAPPTGTFLVRFFDIDGTILKEERRNAGQDATAPSNPDYDPTYLTFAEWNQGFTNVQNDIDVGAIYDTIDGKTYLFLRITDVTGLQPTLQLNKTTTSLLTIDWGDATTNTSTTTGNQNILKTAAYSAIGDYLVTIEDSGEHRVSSSGYIFGNNVTYSRTLLKAYLGTNFRLNFNNAFGNHISMEICSINKESTTYGSGIWLGCNSLIHINFPSGITGISSFFNCHSLRFVSFPLTITTVTNLFNGCNSLESINLTGVTVFGSNSLSACSALTTLTIPEGTTTLGGSCLSSTFRLTSVKIPSTLTTVIGNGTFQNCRSLTELEFPSGLTAIGGNNSFTACTSILEYTFLSTTPPTLGATGVFGSINAACKIYVPDASVAAYKAATNWTVVANYIFPLSTKP